MTVKRTRQLVPAAILFAFLMFTGCRPKYTPAASISDGTIVLLKSGSTNAAFVVTRQSMSPEVVDYTWFLRSDGKSTFDVWDPACSHGAVSNATGVAFGPFNIQWSTAGTAGGYVYYPSPYRWIRMPWGKYWAIKTFGGPSMAVTTERNLAKVDAEDPRWKFHR